MAVKVLIKETGQAISGKFVVIEGSTVGLFSGIMSDKKGGFRGCGKKQTFEAASVTVTAEDAAKEMKRR